MAIEAIARAGAAVPYQSSANQTRPVEQAQPVELAQAQPVVQNVQQKQPQSGGKDDENKNGQDVEKDNERVKKAVTDLNKKMANTSCQFGVHEGTGRVTIKIIDKDTKEILKEYPAEETLEMIEKIWELAGIMVDEKL